MSGAELDLEAITRRLWQAAEQDVTAGPLVAEPWLVSSWSDDKAFSSLLGGSHQKAQPPTKSVLRHGIDFFYDAVARHAASARERPALRYYDPQRGWQSLTYGELHGLSNRLVDRWQKRGVAPGSKLVVLGDVGPAWLLTVVSALRLGATVCVLPASGLEFSLSRLPAVKPDHIFCEPVMVPLLRSKLDKALAVKLLIEEPLAGIHHSGSHTYPPDDPALLLFTAVRELEGKPAEVSAHHLLLGTLRDGLILGLRAGDHVAYPLADLLQHQPALILCVLLAGATWVHIPSEELLRNPRLLGQVPLRVLGVTDTVRDLLLKTPPGMLSELRLWFRNPEEPQQLSAWDRLLKMAPFPSLPMLNMVFDSAAGGSVLFSERTLRRVHGYVLPAPGVPFELKLTAPAGPRSFSGAGLFSPVTQKPGYLILARTPDSYLYGGTIRPRRSGRVYPAADVAAQARLLPQVQEAAVVAVPAVEQPGRWLFLVLLFCGGLSAADPRPELAAQLRGELDKKIRANLGATYLPDAVEVYPLSVRRQESPSGEVDYDWVQSQFASGLLQRKAELPIFRTLSALRAAAQLTAIGRLSVETAPASPMLFDDKEDTDA